MSGDAEQGMPPLDLTASTGSLWAKADHEDRAVLILPPKGSRWSDGDFFNQCKTHVEPAKNERAKKTQSSAN